MTYTREVTNLIVYYWGKGLTAEETVKVVEEKKGFKLGLATVYRHRHSLTAQQIIDVLFNDQRRDIALSEDISLRLKYRDQLLAKLIPQRIESYGRQDVTLTKKIDISLYSEDDKVAILDAYRRISKERSIPDKPASIH